MHYITIVELFYHVPKIQECGMLWDAAIKKWENQTKLKDVMFGLKIAKIGRALLSIKWVNYITQWVRNTSKRQFMHFN